MSAHQQGELSGNPIVIAAGGTGGHLFPAEALAAELLARGRPIVLMTDARSGALSSPLFADNPNYVLRGAGIAGRGKLRAAMALVSLGLGAMQARGLLKKLRPDAIVGFGGYPCLPPILAARSLRRRPAIILHEQNAVLGRANRGIAAKADRLALSSEATTRIPAGTRKTLTGNPVRPAIIALAGQGYQPAYDGAFRLLVLGGSLGASVFSDIVPPALAALPMAQRARLSVVQQCRPEDMERVQAAYDQAGIRAHLAPFFHDIPTHLAQCHLVIARAGASTVAELCVAGRPSILVPLPSAIDDHQTANAAALVDAGGAIMMPQPEFTASALSELLGELIDAPDVLALSAEVASRLGQPDAAAVLADLVEYVIDERAGK